MKNCLHERLKRLTYGSNILGLLTLMSLMFSCTTAKRSMYLQNIKPSETLIDSTERDMARRVYPGDRIIVQIVTIDEEANKAINSIQKASSEMNEGLLVDPAGFIEIPTLGIFKVKGKTPTEIRDQIKSKLDSLFKDASVYCTMTGRVIILNSLSQMGAAASSGGSGGGVLSVPLRDERLTIPEVLSGLRSSNLKLSKTWILREVDGKRQVAKLDLNSASVLQSPFFYLRNNDVIYIEPNKFNQFLEANQPFRNLVGILAGFSGLALAIVLAVK